MDRSLLTTLFVALCKLANLTPSFVELSVDDLGFGEYS